MASAAKNSLYYGIGSILRALTSFLLLPVYANILGASQYGVLNLLQTFSAVVAPLMTLSVEKSLYRLYFDYKNDEDRKEFLSTVFWSICVIGCFVIAICMILGPQLANYLGGVDVVTILYPVIIYTFLSALITYCQILQQTQQQGGKYLIICILMLVIYNVLALLFLYYWTPTYKAEVYASLINFSIVLPIAYFFIKEQIAFKFRYSILKKVLKYTMPLFMMSMFSWILSASDRLFIANYQNTEDVGLYSMAFKMSTIALLFVGAMKQAYDPYFFNIVNSMEENVAKKRVRPVNDTIIFLTSLLYITIALFGKMFVGLFLKEEYQYCITYLYFLLLSGLFTQQATMLNVMILQNKKTIILSLITIICGVLSVVLNASLIPYFGSLMAAINSMIIGVLIFVITWFFAKKNYYVSFKFGNILSAVLIIICCSFFDFTFSNVYIATISKLGIILSFIFLFTKIGVVSYPTMGVIIEKSKQKLGLTKPH